jgi:hypothetical protein
MKNSQSPILCQCAPRPLPSCSSSFSPSFISFLVVTPQKPSTKKIMKLVNMVIRIIVF